MKIKISELQRDAARLAAGDKGWAYAKDRLLDAAPALLEIARTALAYEQSKRSAAKVRRTYHESGLDSLLPGVEAADRDETNCRTAYLDALGEVEP